MLCRVSFRMLVVRLNSWTGNSAIQSFMFLHLRAVILILQGLRGRRRPMFTQCQYMPPFIAAMVPSVSQRQHLQQLSVRQSLMTSRRNVTSPTCCQQMMSCKFMTCPFSTATANFSFELTACATSNRHQIFCYLQFKLVHLT